MSGGSRRIARVQVTSRMTWTFSARAAAGKARPARRGRPPVPATAPPVTVTLLCSAALLRSVLRAVRGRRAPARALRTGRRARFR
ncbi:hypothetical protein NX794_15490 [Streptomyces sp. LP11]|uniref:Uncharacterized protein n=1 Tax=Streptomyces pyxinicus TaxID=2970331 RepID=A0ABT2B287_9ACTN|nr:hypothetical protein [Streptomyces sp. LP11]MCS0602602.1 hypothetical protein [Streptomyces sp. LP11]